MASRLTSTRFVGRQGELAELELAFCEASAGRPGVILLGGDSGVGKTRLTSELESALTSGRRANGEAMPEPALLLRGECLEQGDGELPFAPLIGALRPLVRGKDPVLDRLGPAARSQLSQLLPSIGAAAPDRELALPDANGGGGGQLQLFEALLELLDLLSADRPLLLVIEDAHWADRSTRSFIAFLCRALRDERMLVLLTYRTDELHRRHPLRPLLAELDRAEHARRVELAPFDKAELTEALTDILGRAPETRLIERLLDRTEGNALFVEELLAAGLDGRGSAPQSLNDAFMLRIERLEPTAQQVARAVAVGIRVDQRTLGEVTLIDGPSLNVALREAIAEHVLETTDDDRLQFRHALLREAMYDDLLPGERGDLHLALARALEGQQSSSCVEDDVERIARIATHYAAAGDQPAALRAAITAADKAKGVKAYGDMAELLERALELWPRVEHPEEVSGVDKPEVYRRAASASSLDGNFTRSEQLIHQALELLDAEAEPVRVGRLLALLCRTQWRSNRGTEGLATAERALELLPSGNRSRISLQSWLARTRVLRGQYREALEDGVEALESARAAGMSVLTGEVLNTLGMAHAAQGDVARGIELLEEATQLARDGGDIDDLATAYCNLADLLNLAGRTAEARTVIAAGLAEIPMAVRRSYRWMRLTSFQLAVEAGDWEFARREKLHAPDAYHGTARIYRLLCEAQLSQDRGAAAESRALLDQANPLVHVSAEAQWHGWYGALSAEWHRREGELDAARTAIGRALDELEVCTDDVMRIASVSMMGVRVEADFVLRARDLRDGEAERDALLRAEIHLDRLAAAAQDGGPVESAWLAMGQGEMARATAADDAVDRWAHAAEAFEALGRPYPAATARWRRAEALAGADERDQATTEAQAALAITRRMGAAWLTGELEALCARARLRTAEPAAGPRGPAAQTTAEKPEELPFGLTEREGQVLALLAQGATNRQIGAALYMAEKTASVHVSRILAKLGVQSRTQAAAVAHRMHLAGTGASVERV